MPASVRLSVVFGAIARPGIRRPYAGLLRTKEGRLTRRIRERRTKWANEAWLVSPYYPACAHLRRRMDGELLPQVRTASDLSENETLSSNTKAIC